MKYLPVLVLSLIFLSCSSDAIDLDTIDFSKAKPYLSKDHIKERQFINLETNEEGFFRDVEKVLVSNGKIYILEMMTATGVVCFSENGKYLYTVGKHGEGPEEFDNISDMNFTHEGDLAMLDRVKRRLMIYDESGKLKNTYNLPFLAQSFAALDDGSWAFSLITDNDPEKYGRGKLIITDENFEPIEIVKKYEEGETGAYYTIGHLNSDGTNLLFYKAVTDSLYVFENNGHSKSIHLNFGKLNLPREFQYQMNKTADLHPDQRFEYLVFAPRIIGKYIIGIASSTYGGAKPFLADTKSGKVYISMVGDDGISHTNINKPVGQISNKAFISYLNGRYIEFDRDFDQLPPVVQKHLKEDNTTLIVHYLK